MATDAIQPNLKSRARSGTPVYRPVNKTVERAFFAGMAILLWVVVYIGFAPTYYAAGMVRAPLPNNLLHVHGAIFTLWMVVYFAQTALISARRVAWHRTFGTIAFCLPPIMIVVGVIAGIDAFGRGVKIGPLSPATSLAIPLVGIAGFAVLITAAWRTRRRPDAHKRLILIATTALTQAALGRFPWGKIGSTPAVGSALAIGGLLLLVVAYDLVSLHRVHRSTMWGAPLAFVVAVLAVPIGMTPPWQAFAGLLARYVAPYV